MKKIFYRVLIILIIVVLFPIYKVFSADNFPSPTELKYVNDYAGVLDDENKNYLISVGKELEDKTGVQQVVVIINSLEGNDINSYANGLFRTWGIGQKGKDNGLLILLAIEDRAWRVEVGRGLEGAVTDIYSNRVMEEYAVPNFQKEDYGLGLREAYSVLADKAASEYNVTLEKNITESYTERNVNTSNRRGNSIGIFFIIGFLLLDFIFFRGRISGFLLRLFFWNSFFGGRRGGRGGGNHWGDGGSGGFGDFGGGTSGGGGSSGKW